MSLLEIYRGFYDSWALYTTAIWHCAAASGCDRAGFRVRLMQNTALLCVQGCKLDAVLVDCSNSS